ncbi:MAG: deoxycytidylate deaminase [Pseudomonadota bacterium]
MNDPFKAMQSALDLVSTSPHPSNKIAASLFGSKNNELVTRTNHWPEIIEDHIGREIKIGNSSGTIHAETACLVSADFPTENASICITDPFCPNCAKNIAEAGIKNIYIDARGFEKDFFKRRSGHFETMSMQVAERAGINVFSLDMNAKKQNTILEIEENYTPNDDSPIEEKSLKSADEKNFQQAIIAADEKHKRRKYALAFVKDKEGKIYSLTARAHAVVGYSLQKPDEAIEVMRPIGKYSFIQEPVNRLLMHLARKGYTLIDDYLFCSQVPTSREQVNLVGANIKRITIGNTQKSRDQFGRVAMKQLQEKQILNFN